MMFLLLMKVRLLSLSNLARATFTKHPVLSFGLSLLAIVLFGAIYGVFVIFFQMAYHADVLPETTYQVFYFLFLFLLAGSVPFVASTLLHSSDYSLLFAAPLPARNIVAAKLLDATVTNSLQFCVLGIPTLFACATALGLSWVGWLILPVLIILFALLPAMLTSTALLIVLKFVGMKRLRSAIAILNGVMAMVVCITVVAESSHLPIKPGMLGAAMTTQLDQISAKSPAAHNAPSAWFAAFFLAMGGPEIVSHPIAVKTLILATMKIIGVIGILFITSLVLGEKLLSASNVSDDESGRVITGKYGGNFWRSIFKAPIAALIAKDLRYLIRDTVLLSQISMPLMLFFVPFLLTQQEAFRQLHAEAYPFASVMIGIILFMQTSILSLSSIGLESRSFWVIMSSPNSGYRLLSSKFALSVIVSAGCGLALSIVSAIVFHMSLAGLLIQAIIVVLASTGLCGMGVGLSATFPRFIYENPAHRVSLWALILGFIGSVGYILISCSLFVTVWLMDLKYGLGTRTPILYLIAGLLFLLLTAFAVSIPMTLGAKRIERYQWEH